MIERLKKKWGVTSNLQFWTIIFVFSAAGSSTVWVRRPVFKWLGVTAATPLWVKICLWLAVFFPSYQVLLVTWGTLMRFLGLGFKQLHKHSAGDDLVKVSEFFWEFEKKTLRRLRILPQEK